MALGMGFTIAAVLSTLISSSVALNVNSKTNVAVYYGQGAYQPRLSHFCEESSLDIINLGFINVFPDIVGAWPGSNFGNQCDGTLYPGTDLLSGCHQIWEDIPICKAMGKTIMLSIGGDIAYESILDEDVAIWFADFLWYSFGPHNSELDAIFPRPFQNNSVDGFDFDIEHDGGYGYAYATMINQLRYRFEEYPDQTFYISGAPQCTIPDKQLDYAIHHAAFDFLWVQFYNTEECSARDFSSNTGHFNYDDWVEVIRNSKNPSAKLYVGLPAAEHAAGEGFYLSPQEVEPLVATYMDLYPDTFGGIMLWEATAADNNTVDGLDYSQQMKHILWDCAPVPSLTPTPTPTHIHTVTPTPKPTSHSSSVLVSTSSPVSSAVSTHSTVPAVSTSSHHVSSSTPPVSLSSTSVPHTVAPSVGPLESSTPVVSFRSSSGSLSTPHSSLPSTSVSPSSVLSSSQLQSSSTPHGSFSSSSAKPTLVPSSSSVSHSSSLGSSSTPVGSMKTSSTGPLSSTAKPSCCWTLKLFSVYREVDYTPSVTPCPSSSHSVILSGSSSTSVSVTVTRSSSSSKLSSSTVIVSSHSTSSKLPPPGTRTPVSSSTSVPVSPSRSSTYVQASSSVSKSTVVITSIGVPVPSFSQSAISSAIGSTSSSSSTGSGGPETSAQPEPTGSGYSTITSYISASPSVTPTSSPEPGTTTTIIVTSYTDICPTGFTTITTTYTTTICTEATSEAAPEATASVTGSTSGLATTTASIPEGWTTTVTVCTHCAPTPTTVTLTKPNPTPATEVTSETSATPATVTWTTTVTFCKHCGPTGSTVTLTVPYTPAGSVPVAIATGSHGASAGQSGGLESSGLPRASTSWSKPVISSYPTSKASGPGTGEGHRASQTPSFAPYPSTTASYPSISPSTTQEGVAPVYTGAGCRLGLTNVFGVAFAALISVAVLMCE